MKVSSNFILPSFSPSFVAAISPFNFLGVTIYFVQLTCSFSSLADVVALQVVAIVVVVEEEEEIIVIIIIIGSSGDGGDPAVAL